MNPEQEKIVRELVAALALIPADVKNDWGEYPSHNEAAETIGIYMNGSDVSKFGSVRLGMLASCAPALSALLAERDAMRAVVEAARKLRKIELQRQRDEDDSCAAGATYNVQVWAEAEAALDAALRDLEPKEAEDGKA